MELNYPQPESILKKYEQSLSPLFREISLIIEVPLKRPDVFEIEGALRELIKIHGPGPATRFLGESGPCTLACYFVWKGISDYKHGDYWSAVCDSVSLPKPNWSSRWGEIFEGVLETYDLPTFKHEKAHRYIAPILLHGGISEYCLDDFFDKLVWPTTTGKFYYDNGLDDLLAQWEGSSLRHTVDKPVIRFLRGGGKYAADLLERCLELANAAFESDSPRSDRFGLPKHVHEAFCSWFQNPEKSANRAVGKSAQRVRAPQIVLNLSAQSLFLVFPSQRLSAANVKDESISLEVEVNGERRAIAGLRAYRVGSSIETESCHMDLGGPAKDWTVRLRRGKVVLRAWKFEGVSKDRPWLTFMGQSGALSSRNLPAEFLIVHQADTELVAEARPLEKGSMGREFAAVRFRLENCSGADIHFESDRNEPGRILIDPLGVEPPYLKPVDGAASQLTCSDFQVFQEIPPTLVIPIPLDSDAKEILHKWTISINALEPGASYPSLRLTAWEALQGFDAGSETRLVEIPLSRDSLLGSEARGRFRLSLRGKLGSDRVLRICVLPRVGVRIPPDVAHQENALQHKWIEVFVPPTWELEPISAAKFDTAAADEGKYRFAVARGLDRFAFILRSNESGTLEVPLELLLPNPRWGLVGFESHTVHWQNKPINLSVEDLMRAPDAKLLIRAAVPDGARCTVDLEGTDQRRSIRLTNGFGGLPLGLFCDTLRSIGTLTCNFNLELNAPGVEGPIRREVMTVETAWIVNEVEVQSELDQKRNERRLLLCWQEFGQRSNRILRLWPLQQGNSKPLVERLAEDQRTALIRIPPELIQSTRFRVEFAIDDPWETPSTTVPDPFDENTFDLSLEHEAAEITESGSQESTDLLQRIVTGKPAHEIEFSSKVIDFMRHKNRYRRKFLDKLAIRERQKGDLEEVLSVLCGKKNEHDAVTALAGSILQRSFPAHPEFPSVFAEALARIGYLQRPWTREVKTLFVNSFRQKAERPLTRSEKLRFMQALKEVLEVSRWMSIDLAVEIMLRLLSHTPFLEYNGIKIRGIEGTQEVHGQELIKVWCGLLRNWRGASPTRRYIPLKSLNNLLPKRPSLNLMIALVASMQRSCAYHLIAIQDSHLTQLQDLSEMALQHSGPTFSEELGWAEDAVVGCKGT